MYGIFTEKTNLLVINAMLLSTLPVYFTAYYILQGHLENHVLWLVFVLFLPVRCYSGGDGTESSFRFYQNVMREGRLL